MTVIAQQLDSVLQVLDENRAQQLELLVREAIAKVTAARSLPSTSWPPDYFAATAGALANEPFERPEQGDHPVRESW